MNVTAAPAIGRFVEAHGCRIHARLERSGIVFEVRAHLAGAWQRDGAPFMTFASACERARVLADRAVAQRPDLSQPQVIGEVRPDQLPVRGQWSEQRRTGLHGRSAEQGRRRREYRKARYGC